ncbi:MAG: hypothetical protein DMG00_26550 [Acidobacteria bacterium]|nr:MAG: hypothetical protein DMG00_26550 [Acidobacteriota bacterium]
MASRRRLFVLLYACSGAAALVYEVVWTRLLTLQLGHTVAAASTVLAAFMGGLALGAWIAGSFDSPVDSRARATAPLRAYATLEIVMPLALRASVPALAWAYADGTAPARFGLVRVAISVVVLGVPAAAMGATFPIAAEWLTEAGRLYAANTAGAAIGAVAAGFWLIPAIGLRATTWVGVALNGVAASGAFWLATRTPANTETAKTAEKFSVEDRTKNSLRSQRSRRSTRAAKSSGQSALEVKASPTIAWIAVAVSGFAALVYEVAWTRLLALVIWIAGSFDSPVDSRARATAPLRAYATLEIVIAVSALLLPLALRASVPALAWAYADGTAPARFGLVRVAISVVVLGVPAAAMGATFPIAAEWLTEAGRLYAANTAGAAIGAVAAGFWLIPAIGLRATTWVGVALNGVAASGAFWLATRTPANTETAKTAEKFSVEDRTKNSLRSQRSRRSTRAAKSSGQSALEVKASPTIAWIAVAVSGFAALVYEVAWTRLLALVIGPTTYAFATMAAAFISGLAIGSAAATRIARRTSRPATWLAAMLLVSAVSAVAAAWFAATRMPLVIAQQVADPSVVFGRLVVSQAASVALLLLPMTVALGATFPFALAAASGPVSAEASVARMTSRVYAANTVGAITGALAAGFLLIPRIGLRATFEAAALAAAITGGVCLIVTIRSRETFRSRPGGARPAVASIAAIAVIVAMPGWDRELLSSGAYKYAPYLGAGDLDTVLRAGELEYYKEGAAGTVSVRRLTGTRSMAIDGKIDASDAGDMLTQRLLGLLPVLIHGRAQEVCVIGLGSGVTSASALATGTVQHQDVIEISPEVVEASNV